MDKIVYSNLFYFYNLNAIGGIETWYYNIARMYGQYDLTLVYREADPGQLARLSKYMRCIKWDRQKRFACRRLFINFNYDILPYVECDDIYFFVHGDYEDMIQRKQISKNVVGEWSKKILPRVTKVVAVSECTQQSFYRLTGILPDVCYNPLYKEKPKPFVRLCSAQRMTLEKGGRRIVKLIQALEKYCDDNDASYEYTIYTNQSFNVPGLKNPHRVVVKSPTLELSRIVNNYDYFIALSDNEGYCYSVVEALARGVPCVVTPCPVFEELGLNSKNSLQLEFDCSNVDEVVSKLYDKHPKFKYEAPLSSFEDLLVHDPISYVHEERCEKDSGMVRVKCVRPYKDRELHKVMQPTDEPFEVVPERAARLKRLGVVVVVE